MTFANPAAFWLLTLLPVLFGLKAYGNARSRRAALRVAGPRLLDSLLVRPGAARGWIVFSLECAALFFFIAALARPQWGTVEELSESEGRSLIIAVDTSRSMLATDLEPDRLTRAKLAVIDLIKRLHGDRVGLMPFAGTAFMYAPITPDRDALIESVDSLDADIIPRRGSNLARALDLAVETFKKSDLSGQQALILFSDGEGLEGATMEAARRARDNNVAVICIGVGTTAGGVIPDPESPGGYVRDRDGKVVTTRLEREVLLNIAKITGGLYLPLDGTGVNDSRIDVILQKLQRSSMKGKVLQKAVDRYRWPLGAGLLCLTGSLLAGIARRHRADGPAPAKTPAAPGVALAAALLTPFAFLAAPPGVDAAPAPVTPPAREAPEGNPWEFYRQGDYDAAAANFDRLLKREKGGDSPARLREKAGIYMGKGAAAYRKGDFDEAISAFGGAVLSPDVTQRGQAHYNLGNALYSRAKRQVETAKPKQLAKLSFLDGLIRQLENSLENYQQALVLLPDDENVKKNHDTTDKLIQQLRDIRQATARQQGKGEKGGEEGDDEGDEGDEGENDGQGGKGKRKKGKNGKGSDSGEETDGEGDGGDEEDQEGSGGHEESEEERASREKSNEEREGEVGTDDSGRTPGKGEKPEDGDEPSDSGESGEDDEINPETGFSRNEAKRQLERLSDEDYKVRSRIESLPEKRPLKDW